MTDHGHVAFPADGFEAAWSTWDGAHADSVTLRWENEAWTATTRVGRHDADYVLRLSPLWQVRQFLLFRDLPEPDLWLGTDGHGRWGEVNGAHRPELDGSSEVTLAGSPFTHAVPIRRLAIPVGASATVRVVEVDAESLATVPVELTYVRLAPGRWRVERETGEIAFDTDAHGVPRDLDGEFRRLA